MGSKAKRRLKAFPALVFDTETTGKPLDYKAPITAVDNWPHVVQLGMAMVHPNGDVEEWCRLIKPPNGVAYPIPSEATAIHGITDQMCVEQGVSLHVALELFCFWATGAKAIVAHNLDFDRPVLGCEMHRTKIKPVFPLDKEGKEARPMNVCTMKATMELVGIPLGWYIKDQPYKWPNLQQLHTKLFDVGFEGAHDAMEDVRATVRCYQELIKRGKFTDTYNFLPTQPSK